MLFIALTEMPTAELIHNDFGEGQEMLNNITKCFGTINLKSWRFFYMKITLDKEIIN